MLRAELSSSPRRTPSKPPDGSVPVRAAEGNVYCLITRKLRERKNGSNRTNRTNAPVEVQIRYVGIVALLSPTAPRLFKRSEVQLIRLRVQGEANPLQEARIAEEVAVAPLARHPECRFHLERVSLLGQEPNAAPDKAPA